MTISKILCMNLIDLLISIIKIHNKKQSLSFIRVRSDLYSMFLGLLRYIFSKIFPKPNGEDYTKTQVVIRLIIWGAQTT